MSDICKHHINNDGCVIIGVVCSCGNYDVCCGLERPKKSTIEQTVFDFQEIPSYLHKTHVMLFDYKLPSVKEFQCKFTNCSVNRR